jgi:hypothetical protein
MENLTQEELGIIRDLRNGSVQETYEKNWKAHGKQFYFEEFADKLGAIIKKLCHGD